MPRLLPLLLLPALLLLGCEQDDPFALPPITNNELSSQWVGTYTGTAVLSFGGSDQGERLPATVRIYDLGDDYVRVKIFLTPTFGASEQNRLELPVQSGTRCSGSINVVELWWYGNFTRSGDHLSGGVTVYPVGGSAAAPDWSITGIDANR